MTRGWTARCVELTTARGWLELEVLWDRMNGDIPVLFVAFVTVAVRWDPRGVGGLEVAPGEITDLEEGLGRQEGCKGVVLTGKES